MTADEVMSAAEHLRVGPLTDELRIQFYILQALASIAVNLQRVADTLEEVQKESQQS